MRVTEVCVCVRARCHSCPGQINSDGPRQPAVSAHERESVRMWVHGLPCITCCIKECEIMMTDLKLAVKSTFEVCTQLAEKLVILYAVCSI